MHRRLLNKAPAGPRRVLPLAIALMLTIIGFASAQPAPTDPEHADETDPDEVAKFLAEQAGNTDEEEIATLADVDQFSLAVAL